MSECESERVSEISPDAESLSFVEEMMYKISMERTPLQRTSRCLGEENVNKKHC